MFIGFPGSFRVEPPDCVSLATWPYSSSLGVRYTLRVPDGAAGGVAC
jgi:hypothetical protein